MLLLSSMFQELRNRELNTGNIFQRGVSCCWPHKIWLIIEQDYVTFRRSHELQEKGLKLQISILLGGKAPF